MMSSRDVGRISAMAVLLMATAASGVPRASAQEVDESAERKVMERFLAVLEKTPRRGTALDRVYGYHVEHGSLDELVRRYEDRTKADKADGASWLLLGLVEAQRGRDAAAVAALREAEKIRPDDPLPPYYLGQALVLVGQPDAAVDAFERALTRKPSRVDLMEVYQALGRVHQRARRADKALAVWARLEATFPDDARVREQVAAALAEEDQPEQALAKYEALARDVKDEYRKVQFAIEVAELKVRLARMPDALADFEKLLAKLDPGSWLFKEVRRKIEEVFLRGDDLAGLARYYEGWIKRTPDDVDAMARLGRTYAQLGRAADSRKWLEQAVKLAPSRRELRVALIEQLAQEKKFDEASKQYEEMVKVEPNNPDLVRDWGKLLLRDASKPEAERKKAAAAVWRRLAGDDAKDPVAVAQAADLFRQAEMVDDAIALYKRAIALAPESAQYREYLGEYYHQLKRPADALATWTGGNAKTAAEKGRLGEVLAGFGYRAEALAPATEAVKLAPDDFDLRLKLADLLVQLDKPLDALKELAVADKLADGAERLDAVLAREIAAFQAAKILGDRTNALKAELDGGKDATAGRWSRLARYYEADGKTTEAVQAAIRATEADPKSVTSWATLGRLQEGAGNLGAAADANRTLATLDRRNRADYLSAIARLEARLGRTQEALKAGRELLAAAPGNVEHHQEFAELCFNLAQVDEGLDALRRASRANPSDPKASNILADALARQFRTEEAIELYWKAFDRTRELDARLGVVAKLAEQYIQRNQFDRLISRLERELREPERKRELSICLAQAYQSAGDLSTARQELESLLSANPRDSALLNQLSGLAEAEGDVQAAARYLKLAVEIAPTPDGTAKLGSLYLRAGELAEAEAVWSSMAAADQDAGRAFAAIDSLIASGKDQTVLALTERLLLKRPDDWDALYREGLALINLNKPAEAARRFSKILEIQGNDDDLAAIPKSRKRSATGQATGVTASAIARNAAFYNFPIVQRQNSAMRLRYETKIDTSRNYGGTPGIWTPVDFGQARMAALAWLYAASTKEADPDAFWKARRALAEKPGAEPRALWDDYYLTLVRSVPRETYATTSRLAKLLPNEPSALYVFLASLASRDADPAQAQVVRRASANAPAPVDKTPPLPPAELAFVLESFASLQKRRPDLIQAGILNTVSTELKRAKRDDEDSALYKKSIDQASTLEAVDSVLGMAAERGDVDNVLALADRRERLAPSTGNAVVYYNAPVQSAVARCMGVKAEAKDYDSVLKLLDRQLAEAARPDQVARRLKTRAPSTPNTQNYYMIYTGKASRNQYTTVNFPAPNPYFDYSAIYALRNAYEIYRKADIASDLLARFRKAADEAPEDAKLFPTLSTCYLLWWSDEKDESLKALTRAAELAKNDVELKLSLADLRAERGEPAEALEAADSVEPLDQRTMQRREILALRLSVLSGDVERARKASERLFGLRLDAETQVQLATQMNQLGMHDLSEAVLARARRRSGGNASALVSLMLQYQRQGKADTATQVANQILRQTSGMRNTRPGYYNADDQARTEAVQVLGRSGKLKELISRAEAQLETSPSSIQLLQTLVDYYQADNQRDKAKATQEKIAKLRPDDAKLRFQAGLQLAQSGAAAESLDHFRAALKKDPSLFMNQYYMVQNAFQQANKMDELVKLLDSVDFKTFQNNPYIVQNMISNLFQQGNNAQARDLGLTVLRKAWKEMPNFRPELLGRIWNDEIWKLAEIYDYGREAIIPPAGKPVVAPWAGLDQITSWGNDGEITNLATQLIQAADRQGKLDALADEIEGAVKRSPDWAGGKAILGILKARRGKVDEAKALIEPLAKTDAGAPLYARMVVGQEIDKVEALRDLTIKVLEAGLVENAEEIRNNGNGLSLSPVPRLAKLYKKAGKPEAGRDIVLKAAKVGGDFSNYDPSYAAYQKINQGIMVAGLLQELGCPIDAARFYSELANDSEGLANARQWYGNQDYLTSQIKQGLDKSLHGLDKETLGRSLRATLTPKADAKGAEPRLDLVLLCQPRDLDKAGVVCLFVDEIKALGDQKELAPEARETLDRLVAQHPDDLSILAASAILANADGKVETLAPAVERLAKLADANPLEPLPPNGKANARQRDEAARQLVLWVVARDAQKHDATRSMGEKLGARAIEAAKRQADNLWLMAMLRESGQMALDRGDKAAGELAWREMLKLITATNKAVPPPAGSPATAAPQLAPRATTGAIVVVNPPAKAGQAVVTLERFDQMTQLAKLAVGHDLVGFSVDVMREALAAGPPVTPMAIANPNGPRIIRQSGEPAPDPVAQRVEEQLFELEGLWAKGKAEPSAIYEVMREAVLPKSRPGEILLYARPLSLGNLRMPRSVGMLLVRWAVRAGKADELRAEVEARAKSPMAAAPAKVLLAQLTFEEKKYKETSSLLDQIREGVAKGGLAVDGEQACLVALPALDVKDSAEAASRLLESSIARLATAANFDGGTDHVSNLLLRLARHELASGKVDSGKKHLQEFKARSEANYGRYNGDYGAYMRKYQAVRVADEFARVGLLDETLDQLGQYADAPETTNYGNGADAGSALAEVARKLADLPAADRYKKLKAWTLPTADRKSVRWVVQAVAEIRPPAPFQGPRPVADRGILSLPGLLIDAAREADQLDALAAEVKPMAEAKVENADRLRSTIDLALGRRDGAIAAIKGRLAEVEKLQDQKQDQDQNRGNRASTIDLADAVFARRALASADPDVAASGEAFASKLASVAKATYSNLVMTSAHRDLAGYYTKKAGAPGVATSGDPGLALWEPRRAGTFMWDTATKDRAIWAESDGILAHFAGGNGLDLITFRYPLTGNFEFSVDAYNGTYAEGLLGYGGLFADVSGGANESGVHDLSQAEAIPRPNVAAEWEAFNRLTVRVAPGKVTYLVNNKLLHEDTLATGQSPWLALHATRERQTAFRNPTFKGKPEIPREVALSEGNGLDGWIASGFNESVAPRRWVGRVTAYGQKVEPPNNPDDYDWSAVDGEIRGRKVDPANQARRNQFMVDNGDESEEGYDPGHGPTLQSRLAYVRPLVDGDSISYEFFHKPGESTVHPSLGHLAFLVEPEGVRLHAIVPNNSNAPGLPKPNNVLDDPAGRRERVELRPGDWNSAVVRLKGATASVEINGKLAYERALDPDDDRTFGFYHDKGRTSAKVRKVVLRGDWPAGLTAEQIARPFLRSGPIGGFAERRARASLVHEKFVQYSAGAVAREARSLPSLERYRRLLDWVLPSDDHASIRASGEFGPTDSTPNGEPTLDSPALDLVAVAAELGKLEELADRATKSEGPAATGKRARLAILALTHAAQGKNAEAEVDLKALRDLAKSTLSKKEADWQRWPEYIAGMTLARAPATNPAAVALLDEVVDLLQRDNVDSPMEIQLRHARGVARRLARPDDGPIPAGWIPATLATAESMAQGRPRPIWSVRDGAIAHTPGHSNDMLFLATPLRGDFEIRCHLSTFGWREARLSFAGTSIGLNWEWKHYAVQKYGRWFEPDGPINPPIAEGGDYYPYKVAVKDGRRTTYIRDRKVDERPVGGEGDPWLALFAPGRLTTGVKNLTIAGNPTIPDRVALSAGAGLDGWLGDYYGEATSGDAAVWKKRGDEIFGRKLRDEVSPGESLPGQYIQPKPPETIPGVGHESLLRYVRPVAEDGEITYEFFHEPGKVEVHPALGRLAFLIEPDGVKVHRITDGKHDRTGLDSANAVDEPQNRRGPAKPPLKSGDWNKLVVALKGDEMTLTLNGEVVFVRTIEAANTRDFGLFYFADRAEARARNVVYRGDWPRTLPAGVAAPSP